MLLGHREKMGSQPGDTAKDPLYGRYLSYLAFSGVLGAFLLPLWRRVQIERGAWTANASLEKLADLGALLPANYSTLLIGTAIFIGGTILRLWSIRRLGRLFTFEIGIRPQHKIIEDGPYSYIRHPSYTGYLLMLVGSMVAYANVLLSAGPIIGVLVFFSLRVSQEERMLAKHFGTTYVEYSKRTKRLVPYIY